MRTSITLICLLSLTASLSAGELFGEHEQLSYKLISPPRPVERSKPDPRVGADGRRLLYFTADWCRPCIENKTKLKPVYHLFTIVDMTNEEGRKDPRIKKFGIKTIPYFVLVDKHGEGIYGSTVMTVEKAKDWMTRDVTKKKQPAKQQPQSRTVQQAPQVVIQERIIHQQSPCGNPNCVCNPCRCVPNQMQYRQPVRFVPQQQFYPVQRPVIYSSPPNFYCPTCR